MPGPLHIFREHEVMRGLGMRACIGTWNTDQVAHGHDFLEVELIGAGTGWHHTASGRHRARAGDVFVLRPGAWHGYTDCDGLLIADLHITAGSLRGDAAFLLQMPSLRELLWLRPTSTGRYGVHEGSIPIAEVDPTIAQVEELARDIAERPANQPRLLGRLLTILGTLAEASGSGETPRTLHPAAAMLLQQIESEAERDWTLAEFAELVNLDRAYLTRLFRDHVGLPPMAYVARVRAERAADLLTNTDEPVARVGAMVGWPDPAHFTRRFRALAGTSPSDYRRKTQRA